jgi:SWI/SNF-related matrix-associated actin-dependent regulator 1 of chromatin subfamily A
MTNKEILARLGDLLETPKVKRPTEQESRLMPDFRRTKDRPTIDVKSTPYPFQAEDVRRVWEEFNGRALIAWSPGLGKSFAALYGAALYLKKWPMVVVCPASVKEVWRRECLKHLGMRSIVLDGKSPHPIGSKAQIYVINYDILGVPRPNARTWTEALMNLDPGLVVLDEVHMTRNRDTARTKACRFLCRQARHVLGLSGTPLVNRPAELWPFLNMVRPDLYKSFWSFASDFCNLHKAFFGWDWSGASNLVQLHSQLCDDVMVRRRKEDVIADLPPHTLTVVPLVLPPAAAKEYRRAEREFVHWLTEISPTLARRAMKAEGLTRKIYLRQLVARLKKPLVEDWIRDFKNDGGGKLLVWGVHHAMLDSLHETFARSVLLTGRTPQKQRIVEFDRFNGDPNCTEFFGNLEAASQGWSCTSADTHAVVEPPWVPGLIVQAMDRTRGIDRGTGRPTWLHFLVAQDTIDADLCKVLQSKMGVIDQTLDGRDYDDLKLMDDLDAAILHRVGKA